MTQGVNVLQTCKIFRMPSYTNGMTIQKIVIFAVEKYLTAFVKQNVELIQHIFC